MPMKSQKQWKKMFSLEDKGLVKPGTAEEFAQATPGGFSGLPKKVGTQKKRRRRVIP